MSEPASCSIFQAGLVVITRLSGPPCRLQLDVLSPCSNWMFSVQHKQVNDTNLFFLCVQNRYKLEVLNYMFFIVVHVVDPNLINSKILRTGHSPITHASSWSCMHAWPILAPCKATYGWYRAFSSHACPTIPYHAMNGHTYGSSSKMYDATLTSWLTFFFFLRVLRSN